MDYNVYNYFVGNYAQKPATKYDAHKSSELRSVMKNIFEQYAFYAVRGFAGQRVCTEKGRIL